MNATIRTHLAFLYGESAANALAEEINNLIRAATAANVTRPSSLTERDSILITYGDQVRAESEPPLRTLGRFLKNSDPPLSAVHLLPFYPWSSDDGFSVKDYYGVDPALGTWDDIATLGRDFDLMFDAVFNHASAQSAWFARFLRQEPGWENAFVTVEGSPNLSQVVRPRALPLLTEFETAAGGKRVWTTFSSDQVDINIRDPRMLLRLLDVLLFYVGRGARFIRLDAIAFLWKEIGTPCIHLPQTHRAIQLMRAVLDAAAPGVAIITETNVPHADNLSYFGDGTNEAQLVYNFAMPPLVFHTLRAADASYLTGWAKTLELPSNHVTLFNFLASHDGIGLNPARGILPQGAIDSLVQTALNHGGFVSYKNMPDGSRAPYELNISYFDALSKPASSEPLDMQIRRFLAAHAIMLVLRGVPGIYFHSLFGSRGDRAGAEASGIPRRINRQKLSYVTLQHELAAAGSLRSRVFASICKMMRMRRAHPAFHPFGEQEILDFGPDVFAVRRRYAGQEALCIVNVTDRVAVAGDREFEPYEYKIEFTPQAALAA